MFQAFFQVLSSIHSHQHKSIWGELLLTLKDSPESGMSCTEKLGLIAGRWALEEQVRLSGTETSPLSCSRNPLPCLQSFIRTWNTKWGRRRKQKLLSILCHFLSLEHKKCAREKDSFSGQNPSQTPSLPSQAFTGAACHINIALHRDLDILGRLVFSSEWLINTGGEFIASPSWDYLGCFTWRK